MVLIIYFNKHHFIYRFLIIVTQSTKILWNLFLFKDQAILCKEVQWCDTKIKESQKSKEKSSLKCFLLASCVAVFSTPHVLVMSIRLSNYKTNVEKQIYKPDHL